VSSHDEDYGIIYEKLVLEYEQEKLLKAKNCESEVCIAQPLKKTYGLTAETVVASSVVIAGNGIYWLKKQGACLAKSPE
jgi:hypothetical protein